MLTCGLGIGLGLTACSVGEVTNKDYGCVAETPSEWVNVPLDFNVSLAAEYLEVSKVNVAGGKIGSAACTISVELEAVLTDQSIQNIEGVNPGISDTCLVLASVDDSSRVTRTYNPIILCPAE